MSTENHLRKELEIVRRLRREGTCVSIVDGKIRMSPFPSAEIAAEMREHKPAIFAMLQAETDACKEILAICARSPGNMLAEWIARVVAAWSGGDVRDVLEATRALSAAIKGDSVEVSLEGHALRNATIDAFDAGALAPAAPPVKAAAFDASAFGAEGQTGLF